VHPTATQTDPLQPRPDRTAARSHATRTAPLVHICSHGERRRGGLCAGTEERLSFTQLQTAVPVPPALEEPAEGLELGGVGAPGSAKSSQGSATAGAWLVACRHPRRLVAGGHRPRAPLLGAPASAPRHTVPCCVGARCCCRPLGKKKDAVSVVTD
jgi:hypothetical protein